MLRSLYAGISGMKVNQTKLDIIANNIANVGTTAFKSSRIRFEDMVSQSMSAASASSTNEGGINPEQVGLGVKVAGIDTIVSQGMMQPTSRNLDVAVDGEGYLMVAKGASDVLPVVNSGVTNKITDADGAEISYTRDGALALDDAGHLLTSDGKRVLGYAIGGSILNNNDGTTTVKYVDANATNTVADGANLIPLSIPDTVDVDGTATRVTTFSIEKDGVIKAVLSNGKVSAIGQIAMASFKNPAGLLKSGDNEYTSTSNSGDAVVRTGLGAATDVDNSKGYGDMQEGMLEMSNVDLSEQFTDMIVASRAFQAMGKTITTGDEILQDIIGLKR